MEPMSGIAASVFCGSPGCPPLTAATTFARSASVRKRSILIVTGTAALLPGAFTVAVALNVAPACADNVRPAVSTPIAAIAIQCRLRVFIVVMRFLAPCGTIRRRAGPGICGFGRRYETTASDSDQLSRVQAPPLKKDRDCQ